MLNLFIKRPQSEVQNFLDFLSSINPFQKKWVEQVIKSRGGERKNGDQ